MNVAIIPARQNSKGILNKNLQTVGNLSLLGHAIVAAQQARIFHRIIVSTDGEELANQALQLNAEVIMRPAELATDEARSIDAVCHALLANDITEGTITLLQPTSPLRKSEHIQAAFALYDSHQRGSVVSVCLAEHHPYKMLIASAEGYRAVGQISDLEQARQQLPLSYRPNGAIYINDTVKLLEYRRFFIDPIQLYVMSENDSIDIDSSADLERANILFNKRIQNEPK